MEMVKVRGNFSCIENDRIFSIAQNKCHCCAVSTSLRSNEKNKKSNLKVRELFSLFRTDLSAQFEKVILFRSKETRLFEKSENTFTLTHYFKYPCSCFKCIVNKSYELNLGGR